MNARIWRAVSYGRHWYIVNGTDPVEVLLSKDSKRRVTFKTCAAASRRAQELNRMEVSWP